MVSVHTSKITVQHNCLSLTQHVGPTEAISAACVKHGIADLIPYSLYYKRDEGVHKQNFTRKRKRNLFWYSMILCKLVKRHRSRNVSICNVAFVPFH